jgi:hypothetical protein
MSKPTMVGSRGLHVGRAHRGVKDIMDFKPAGKLI